MPGSNATTYHGAGGRDPDWAATAAAEESEVGVESGVAGVPGRVSRLAQKRIRRQFYARFSSVRLFHSWKAHVQWYRQAEVPRLSLHNIVNVVSTIGAFRDLVAALNVHDITAFLTSVSAAFTRLLPASINV